ncbi:hypothetical protein B0H21DRAFT_519015 [Amylocystis lapponica]|nr:hypothetical protein B0H21DRAFT_519015 [Amylocystis lapponica]
MLPSLPHLVLPVSDDICIYTDIQSISKIPSQVSLACTRHIRYLEHLKQGWQTLRVPQSWMDFEFGDFPVDRNSMWELNAAFIYSNLAFIKDKLTLISEDALDLQSPEDPVPNFRLSSERHKRNVGLEYKDPWTRMWMTFCQVAQILRYQFDEALAECTVSIALEGVPSTYVRRRDLAVHFGAASAGVDSTRIDCALIYTAIGPTMPYTFSRLRTTSINPVNPALALCTKGPARWREDESPSRDLPDAIRSMTPAFNGSLLSIMTAWRARRGETGDFPDWAVPIGIVYDSTAIHLFAHIPYVLPGATQLRYLSMHFDTLPFPASGDSAEFITSRYRVALAMLCIQHHVYHLTTVWETIDWRVFDELIDGLMEIPSPDVLTPISSSDSE